MLRRGEPAALKAAKTLWRGTGTGDAAQRTAERCPESGALRKATEPAETRGLQSLSIAIPSPGFVFKK